MGVKIEVDGKQGGSGACVVVVGGVHEKKGRGRGKIIDRMGMERNFFSHRLCSVLSLSLIPLFVSRAIRRVKKSQIFATPYRP